MENKTPKPEQPGGGQDANNMGGPQFHPQVENKDDTSHRDTMDKNQVSDTQILDEDQVPPL